MFILLTMAHVHELNLKGNGTDVLIGGCDGLLESRCLVKLH